MTKREAKTVKSTAIQDHTYRVFPNDLNSHGTVFGGLVMSIIDRLAHVVAERHSGQTCVTASADSIIFLAPAGRGENLVFKASINRAWNTSMEIGVRVEAEVRGTLERKHIVSAYLTFVALDEQLRPTLVPPVKPESKREERRYHEAEIRRNHRISQREEIKKERNQ